MNYRHPGLRIIKSLIWQQKCIEKETSPITFYGIPDRWYTLPTYRCCKGHIMHMYLKTEGYGNVCITCREPIFLTYPEDTENVVV